MLLRAGVNPRAAHGRCQKETIHLNKTQNQPSSNTGRAGSNINTTAVVTQKEQQAGDLARYIKSSHTRRPEWTIFIVILCKYHWVSLKWCHICRYQLLEFIYGTKPPHRHSSLQALHQLICSVLLRKVKEILPKMNICLHPLTKSECQNSKTSRFITHDLFQISARQTLLEKNMLSIRLWYAWSWVYFVQNTSTQKNKFYLKAKAQVSQKV